MSGDPEGQSEETQKRQPPKTRFVIVRVFRALKRYENRRRRRRNSQHQVNERMMARWTRHVGLFTGALVVVGIVTAIIFWRQLNVMQSQLGAMKDANKDTHSALVDVQRAFITVSSLREEIVHDQAGKSIWRYTPAIENSGTTPTTSLAIISITPRDDWIVKGVIIVRAGINSKDPTQNTTIIEHKFLEVYRQAGPPDPDEFFSWSPADLPSQSTISTAVLGPKAITYPSIASEDISIEDTIRSQADEIGRFFYGAIHYTDVFKVKHTTKYCFRIDGIIMSPTGNRPYARLCPHWNCVDQACDDDKVAFDADVKELEKRDEEVRQRLQRYEERLKHRNEQTPPPQQK